jgi:hypothetical protein
MSHEYCSRFADNPVTSYAKPNVLSGRCPPERAMERARAEYEGLLPQDLDTPGHFESPDYATTGIIAMRKDIGDEGA